jgi:mannose-6-phosphate isomerase-like protein (cupin superfamily)
MPIRPVITGVLLAAIVAGGTGLAQAQQTPVTAWAPQPVKLAPFTKPNQLHKRLADVLGRHKAQKSWSETMAITRDFIAEYVQMAPGEKTKAQFWADDRIFWVVQSGQIRFHIDGQQPFVASKGFIVQVPYRNAYWMETVGDEPSLRFEVRAAGEIPSYVLSETPTAVKGWKFVQATYTGKDTYNDVNKPYLDFNKTIVQEGGRGGGFVRDDHTWANVIRGRGAPVPPPTQWGHFHENFDELWIVLEGQEDFLVEGEKLISATTGDIVFAPRERWHRATHGGTGMSTRLAITPRPPSLHYEQTGARGGE